MARDVDGLVGELRTLWDPQGGNFRQSFIDGVGRDAEELARHMAVAVTDAIHRHA